MQGKAQNKIAIEHDIYTQIFNNIVTLNASPTKEIKFGKRLPGAQVDDNKYISRNYDNWKEQYRRLH